MGSLLEFTGVVLGAEEPTLPSIVSPNLPRRRPMRTLLMMSPHSTRAHQPSHHHPLVQFMQRLHMLTSLSTSPNLSSSVFNDLTTLMLLYSRFLAFTFNDCDMVNKYAVNVVKMCNLKKDKILSVFLRHFSIKFPARYRNILIFSDQEKDKILSVFLRHFSVKVPTHYRPLPKFT
ncbi:hypothetical protein GOBAR_AA29186 [Gossypium barbadense]|uniref:Uncharacterized protein n=1 Tax=Gossypium barbadense TaxID=3634 RepID=A0A2P5WK87_GOSBA|nr:hypothetical protein GOBAR_AA29186 [Gossypium barbadense]